MKNAVHLCQSASRGSPQFFQQGNPQPGSTGGCRGFGQSIASGLKRTLEQADKIE